MTPAKILIYVSLAGMAPVVLLATLSLATVVVGVLFRPIFFSVTIAQMEFRQLPVIPALLIVAGAVLFFRGVASSVSA